MDYPTKLCIVCANSFTPKRKDQIFCSLKESYTCSDNLRRAERFYAYKFYHALLNQGMKCWGCGVRNESEGGEGEVGLGQSGGLVVAPTARLQCLILTPSLANTPNQAELSIPQSSIVAACLACRREYYTNNITTNMTEMVVVEDVYGWSERRDGHGLDTPRHEHTDKNY